MVHRVALIDSVRRAPCFGALQSQAPARELRDVWLKRGGGKPLGCLGRHFRLLRLARLRDR
jgi:hypothetical protein